MDREEHDRGTGGRREPNGARFNQDEPVGETNGSDVAIEKSVSEDPEGGENDRAAEEMEREAEHHRYGHGEADLQYASCEAES